ncbi:MAG TPA: hypothetical protein VK970_22355 [Candidatus Methylacidiphilales bacterium]|nr:hypothetical protein [Candidatus Methylacidiphilales bacterium]
MQWVSLAMLYMSWRAFDRLVALVTRREPYFAGKSPRRVTRIIPRAAKYRNQPVVLKFHSSGSTLDDRHGGKERVQAA